MRPLGLAQNDRRRAQTRNLGGPWPGPVATNPREDPPREKNREEMGAGRRKKTEILDGPAEGGPGEGRVCGTNEQTKPPHTGLRELA